MNKLTKIFNWWPNFKNINFLLIIDKIFDVRSKSWYDNRTPKAQEEIKNLLSIIGWIVLIVSWYILNVYGFKYYFEPKDLGQLYLGSCLSFLISVLIIGLAIGTCIVFYKYCKKLLLLLKEDNKKNEK